MNEEKFKARTKQVAIAAIELTDQLPKRYSASVISKQLIRSATSVGANYRSACRGRTAAEIIARMGIVETEADESLYWMELIVEAQLMTFEKVRTLYNEMEEILAMTVSSVKTLKGRFSQSQIANRKSKMGAFG